MRISNLIKIFVSEEREKKTALQNVRKILKPRKMKTQERKARHIKAINALLTALDLNFYFEEGYIKWEMCNHFEECAFYPTDGQTFSGSAAAEIINTANSIRLSSLIRWNDEQKRVEVIVY